MSMVKVIELSAQSAQGYEDAVRQAVERVARTIRNIRSVWVKEFEAVVENDQVTQFRVTVKISFLLEEGMDAGSGLFLRAAHAEGPDAPALRSGG